MLNRESYGKVRLVKSMKPAKGGDIGENRMTDKLADWLTEGLQSARTAAAWHGAQLTRWRFIEGFGGCLPVARISTASTGTKRWGNSTHNTCIRYAKRRNLRNDGGAPRLNERDVGLCVPVV